MPSSNFLKGKRFRLVIPHLQQFGRFPARDHQGLENFKHSILEKLRERQTSRGLEHWCIAWQTHPATGYAHLDILLLYSRLVKNSLSHYDYLAKHGDLTRYRTVNRAILRYGTKQDPRPLMNFSPDRYLLQTNARKSESLHVELLRAMRKDPFHFDAQSWLTANELWAAAGSTNVFKVLRMVRREQISLCHQKLVQRPGIRMITPTFIEHVLTSDQLKKFCSWPGYQTIVDHINQISRWGWHRPHKTPHLLLVGRPNVGKTTLCMAIEQYCSTYPLGTVGGWFPEYKSRTYAMLTWDQFSLSVYSYPTLLRLLEGRPMKVPQKGGHVMRSDNQLIVMTSNLSLRRHICRRFSQSADRETAQLNLEPRITEVVVPPRHDLFLLVKLIAKKCPKKSAED